MARITKADIYKKYGIEFDGKYITSPIGKIRELLKQGNSKVGKHVWTFSLLPTNKIFHVKINGVAMDIRGTCPCHCVGCYATTGHYTQHTAKQSMAINTYLVNNHIDFVKRAITAQLEYIGRGEVRIHASGDFMTENSSEYSKMWLDIAKMFPSIRFWTYTKCKCYESLFDNLKNANIVKSIIPEIGINFGHCDYIINTYYTLREIGKTVYICKCGIDKNQHCERCGVCATYEYVLFLEHSTAYNAEKDPLYGKLCEVVMNQ